MTKISFYSILWCMVFGLCAEGLAQGPLVPKEFGWNTASEYRNETPLVEQCLEWLCTTPLTVNMELRSEANAFVMAWLAGSPDCNMEINSKALPFLEQNEELFFVFVHGMARYKLQHPEVVDSALLHAEGLNVLAGLCNQDVVLSEAQFLKPILKAWKRKKMEQWVVKQFSS